MTRLLIVGAGDVARRLHARLPASCTVAALVRRPDAAAEWRARGVRVFVGDLDQRRSLDRLRGWAHAVVHLAPPDAQGLTDRRTRNLLAALEGAPTLPQRLIYISTTGVWGDRGGAFTCESSPIRPTTARACRRADAEARVRAFARRHRVGAAILRVPGIYAGDRLPEARLSARLPMLHADDDVFTNHIHADDLAAIIVAALHRARPCRIYTATDDDQMKMGDFFDAVADATGRPRLPRIARADADGRISPALMSYLSESRRLDNTRIKRELGVRLAYPGVAAGLAPSVGGSRPGPR